MQTRLHSSTQRGAFWWPLAAISPSRLSGAGKARGAAVASSAAALAAFLMVTPAAAKTEHPDHPFIDEALHLQRLESWRFPRVVRLVRPVKSVRRDDDDDDEDEEYAAAATRAQTPRHDAGYDVGALRGMLWAGAGGMVLLVGFGLGRCARGRG